MLQLKDAGVVLRALFLEVVLLLLKLPGIILGDGSAVLLLLGDGLLLSLFLPLGELLVGLLYKLLVPGHLLTVLAYGLGQIALPRLKICAA